MLNNRSRITTYVAIAVAMICFAGPMAANDAVVASSDFSGASLAEENWTHVIGQGLMWVDTANQEMDFFKDGDVDVYIPAKQGQWDLTAVSSYMGDGDVWTISFDFRNDSRTDPLINEIIMAIGQNICYEEPGPGDAPDRMVKLLFVEDGPGFWRLRTTSQGDDDPALTEQLAFDVWYHIDIVFNKSGSTLNDYMGSEDLSDNNADFWINGELGIWEYALTPPDGRGMVEEDPISTLALRVDKKEEGWASFDNFEIRDGAYVVLEQTNLASNPDPGNGTTHDSNEVQLRWVPGEGALTHDVYFGTTFEAVDGADTDSDEFMENTIHDKYPNRAQIKNLVYGQTYFWRIDEVNDPNVWTGTVWSFMVRPMGTWDPSPPDGAKFVPTDVTLTWKAGAALDDITGRYDVFFGTTWADVNEATYEVPLGVWLDEPLEGFEFLTPSDFVTVETDTEYFWRVASLDGDYNTLDRGNVWSFTTSFPNQTITSDGSFIVTRLNNKEPIITQSMFEAAGVGSEGANINGPSVIRIPDWIAPGNRAHPDAVYYLYFAHHEGSYIRMAWAEYLEGPWHLYNTPGGGVLSLNIDNGSLSVRGHIASPDVHVDDENQRIIMYLHGYQVKWNGVNRGQRTVVTTSPYGLDFNGTVEPVILGISYFRVFEYGGNMHALANSAKLYMARDADDPWYAPPDFDFYNDYLWYDSDNNPFTDDLVDAGFVNARVRHTTVRLIGDTLQVFYSRKRDDGPERIQMSTIDLSVGDYELWDSSYPPEEILQAEEGWEGGQYPPIPSEGGPAPENVNQLRDPYIFEDTDGALYLFYTGCGEDAIGLALLQPVLAGDFEPDGDVDLVDVGTLMQFWLTDESSVDIAPADDPDGIINLLDFAILAENWTEN